MRLWNTRSHSVISTRTFLKFLIFV